MSLVWSDGDPYNGYPWKIENITYDIRDSVNQKKWSFIKFYFDHILNGFSDFETKVPLEETDSARGLHFDILGTIHNPEFFKLNECDGL